MITASIAGLVKIELPSAVTVRLCDGGRIVWGSEVFTARHGTYGAIASLKSLSEGVGDEIPALEMVLMPDKSASIGSLIPAGFQTSRCRFWITTFNPATSAVIGTPDLIFDGMLDQGMVVVGRKRRDLATTVVATVEKLFTRNIGNSLNPAFHKAVWPGETGHDNASRLTRKVAWGAESPSAPSVGGPEPARTPWGTLR